MTCSSRWPNGYSSSPLLDLQLCSNLWPKLVTLYPASFLLFFSALPLPPQLIALLLLSAASAGAAITTFNDHGRQLFNYAPCVGPEPYSRFCSRTKTSVAFAFIAFGFFIPHLALSTIAFLVRVMEG